MKRRIADVLEPGETVNFYLQLKIVAVEELLEPLSEANYF